MLGFETERRLYNLFEEVRVSEIAQENRRQRLCMNPDFAPYSAFMRIDRNANERISKYEILDFFRDNREYTISDQDCHNIVKYFDSNEDGQLNFNE